MKSALSKWLYEKVVPFLVVIVFLHLGGCIGKKKLLRIIHTNDLNGVVEASGPQGDGFQSGGLPHVVSVIRKLVAEADSKGGKSLVLDCGDAFSGSTLALISSGEAPIELMNLAGYSAMVPGNKELNFGSESLAASSKKATFTMLGANVLDSSGNRFPFLRAVKTVYVDTMKIGIVGLVPKSIAMTISPRYSGNFSFDGEDASLSEGCDELKADKPDMIVAISHMDMNQVREMLLASSGGNTVDVAISAENYYGPKSWPSSLPEKVGNAMIVHGTVVNSKRFVGCLDLYLDSRNRVSSYEWKLVPVDASKTDALPEAIETLEKFKPRMRHWEETVLGEAMGDFQFSLRTESPLGDMIADIMREKTGADASLINASAIKKGLAAGRITKKSILDMLPYENPLVTMEILGEHIESAVIHSINPKSRSALLCSGMSYGYKLNLGGEKILSSVSIRGRPIDRGRFYKIATTGFLAEGGNHFSMLTQGRDKVFHTTLKEAVIEWVREKRSIDPDSVKAGRIQESR